MADGEEAARPWGPGTADVLCLGEKCSAALIVLKICLRNFPEKSSGESKNCPFKMSVESNIS
jgi:hypothetical protein